MKNLDQYKDSYPKKAYFASNVECDLRIETNVALRLEDCGEFILDPDLVTLSRSLEFRLTTKDNRNSL